ncbi:fumarylacetoacetate hydrolase family protein [Bacillus sp. FJAT-44742]|uniref:fumarylacetoacetate hydrolase family protein n=1 Tax=Bacillus sp. FJAT-44742 TaxID=2014005 RepID=UPI000C23D877|nr:fumarylacetoacetate hydrolase family protein [Bacillus sp. FJAT-44742]
MKFVTARIGEYETAGVVTVQEQIIDLKQAQFAMKNEVSIPETVAGIIEEGVEVMVEIKKVVEWASHQKESKTNGIYSLSDKDVSLKAPIPQPPKNVLCIGKNYADHAAEMGAENLPSHPIVFTKAPTTIIGPEEEIDPHKEVTSELDYEGEIGVVIGRRGRGISKEEAKDYIFGYTLINDITARDLQQNHKQFFLGKSLDTSCPMGPYIVHKDSVSHPDKLELTTKVNGEVRQQGNTSQLIFDIPTLIHILSKGMTLEPGDVIATGTPAGVGKGFTPPKFLQPGDEIEITVKDIGTLINRIKK